MSAPRDAATRKEAARMARRVLDQTAQSGGRLPERVHEALLALAEERTEDFIAIKDRARNIAGDAQ
jgi:hypothetical protein